MSAAMVLRGMAAALLLTAAPAAASVNAGANATSAGGVRAHFVVGAFDDPAACRAAFEEVRERIEGDARWVGERVRISLSDCAEVFAERSVHRSLQDGRPFANAVLSHPNVRAVLISPRGAADEMTLCEQLAGYVQQLFGAGARCVAPTPAAPR